MCHVLIIEDEPFIAMDIQDILTSAGATSFDFATTQDEAVAAADLHLPDVITSDVKLIEGTGPAAVAHIHRSRGDIPVLFITATPGACKPCEPPGRIIAKPLNRQTILDAFCEAARL